MTSETGTRVCRTCLSTIDNNFNRLCEQDETFTISYKNMLSTCIPEMELSHIGEELICEKCIESLLICYSFTNKCRNSENAIRNYMNLNNIFNINKIDLTLVVKRPPATVYDVIPNIKTEKLPDEFENTCIQADLVQVKYENDDNMEENNIILDAELPNLKHETVEIKSEEPSDGPKNKKVRKSNHCKACECPICSAWFEKVKNLKEHLRTDHPGAKPYKCQKCDRSFRLAHQLREHEPKHNEVKPFKCDQCDMSYHTRPHLKRHMMSHTGERPYKCSFCPKGFTAHEDRRIHERLHTGVKPFKCEQCDKAFIKKTTLKCHLRTHKNDKPFACDRCDKKYYYKGKLMDHIKMVHDKVPPKICEICGKGYTSIFTLNVHKRVHGGARPHQCEICKKSFYEQVHLKLHMRGHTGERPYCCELCKKCFTQPNALKYHKLMHTGEKSFKCDVCEKSFVDKGRLNKHKKTHIGAKPYFCEYCNGNFAEAAYLKYHKKKFHSDLIHGKLKEDVTEVIDPVKTDDVSKIKDAVTETVFVNVKKEVNDDTEEHREINVPSNFNNAEFVCVKEEIAAD